MTGYLGSAGGFMSSDTAHHARLVMLAEGYGRGLAQPPSVVIELGEEGGFDALGLWGADAPVDGEGLS